MTMAAVVDDPEAYVRELIAQELAKQKQTASSASSASPSGKNDDGCTATAAASALSLPKHPHNANDAKQLRGMREWIASLPDDGIELLRCMEFDFVCPPNAMSTSARGGNGGGRWSGGDASTAAADVTSDVSSDILLQLLQSQVAPPTPIHPRAVPYKSASCAMLGATDGRNEEERVRRERFRRPRLFRLVERSSSMSSCRSSAPTTRTSSKRGGRNRSVHRHNGNGGSSNTNGKRYDVIARKFITSAGEKLSMGSTETQRLADDALLGGMVLTCDLEHDGRQVGFDNLEDRPSIRRRCHLCVSESETNALVSGCKSRKQTILDILYTASRGRLFSSNPEALSTDVSSFCAPWLDPMAEWFSLPVFLASRCELALWNTYNLQRHSGGDSLSSSLGNYLSRFHEKELERSLQFAISRAFADLLRREDTSSGLIRDGRVWRLLSCTTALLNLNLNLTCGSSHNYASAMSRKCNSMLSIPLIDAGSTSDEYRSLVFRYFRERLAVQAQTKLLVEFEEKKSDSPVDRASTGKRTRKKKKKGRKSRRSPLKPIDEASHFHEEDDSSPIADISGSEGIDQQAEDDFLLTQNKSSPTLPSTDKNQNTIMALQIMDEVLCAVFDKVGLSANEEDNDQSFVEVGGKQEKTKRDRNTTYLIRTKPAKRSVATLGSKTIPSTNKRLDKSSTPLSPPQYRRTSNGSMSLLSYSSNPYHHPQSPHEHVFSFMDSSQSNYSMQAQGDTGSAYDSIFEGGSPLGMSLNLGGSGFGGSGTGWEWNGLGGRQYASRNRSLFTEFFDNEDPEEAEDIDELLMAASTAASIASSNARDDESDVQHIRYEDDEDDESELVDETESVEKFPKSAINTKPKADEIGHESKMQDDENLDDDEKISLSSDITEPGRNRSIDPALSSEVQDDNRAFPEDEGYEGHDVREISTASSPIILSAPKTPPPLVDVPEESYLSPTQNTSVSIAQSPAPSEPPTPPPQLSPIQISLADLGKFIKVKNSMDLSKEFEKATSVSVSSLPGSPRLDNTKRTWPRDDLSRLSLRKDDAAVKRKRRLRSASSHNFEEVMNYRNALSKSLKAASTCSHEVRSDVAGSIETRRTDLNQSTGRLLPRRSIPDLKSFAFQEVPIVDSDRNLHVCARSETALDNYEDSSHVNVMRVPTLHDEVDNVTTTKDGATTISSAVSPGEAEELTNLREERNAFRDLCLTLGAEVAKLKSTVAALQQGQSTTSYTDPRMQYGAAAPSMHPYLYPPAASVPSINPQYFPQGYAMSDAGIMQGSARSDDGTENHQGQSDSGSIQQQWTGQGHPASFIHIRRPSLGCNRTVSSVDHDAGCHGSIAVSALRSSVHRDTLGGVPSHGLQSRLSADINAYCLSLASQLKTQEKRRLVATKRLTRLVTTLWPRAQVKLYGSHITNLCLPSSDLDFVICLPSVHNVELPTKSGVLEGRNAINETNQKVLARKLKGESWIDPRSIKVIERTAIPVIKVSTKDKRSRILQLDISFDGPNHHGLEAIQLVTDTMQEYPMCRPLMLVLKQFLLDRGLLTAYTGGLSSYGLFLMLSRYLQEQAVGAWADCGSLLMGFLDYYGNFFDPRQTGISVRNRHYFSRPFYSPDPSQHLVEQPPMWNMLHLHPTATRMVGKDDFPDLSRRHSFGTEHAAPIVGSGTNAIKNSPKKHTSTKPPRIQTKRSSSHHSLHNECEYPRPLEHHPHHEQNGGSAPVSRPYTFDPLMMIDPLNGTNNIGRNTFRIFQVLRAFSDAHRALVASLEWDMNSVTENENENDYPLLKSLFHNEDVFFDSESGLSLHQPN